MARILEFYLYMSPTSTAMVLLIATPPPTHESPLILKTISMDVVCMAKQHLHGKWGSTKACEWQDGLLSFGST